MKKKVKEKIDYGMYAELKNNILNYYGKDYSFSLTDEKYHNYATLIISPKHIKVLDNKTNLNLRELKDMIISEWFAEENAFVREQNNNKRRAKLQNIGGI